jgi:hypothetical protein
MRKVISILFLLIASSVQAHEDPLKDDPDPCLYLAIPYDFCLQTIGKEWWERQVKNAPPSLESRIKKLEKRIKELGKELDSKSS